VGDFSGASRDLGARVNKCKKKMFLGGTAESDQVSQVARGYLHGLLVGLGLELLSFRPRRLVCSAGNGAQRHVFSFVLALLKFVFNFVLGPRGPGGGSGLPFSKGNHRFWADSGPNQKQNTKQIRPESKKQ
jgi:hypothetical protein